MRKLISKAFAPDSIFGRDRFAISRDNVTEPLPVAIIGCSPPVLYT